MSYIGCDELILYLNERKNKSFLSFLLCNREVVVTSTLSSSVASWSDLNNAWTTHFLEEAEKLDQSTFSILDEKVHIFLFCKEG